MIIETNSARETFLLGRECARAARPGEVYCLQGDLGTGKTVFTQGFAAGLGITEPVSSPTFTVIKEYHEGRLPFYHFDVYRIEDPVEMDEIGYEDCFWGEGVSLVEWADIVSDIFPEDTIKVTIEKDLSKGVDYRMITIEDHKDEDNSH